MEKSILQDKPVKRPNLAREIESELYDKQFVALGRLNPSAISVGEYDKDITYDQNWAKDAYHTYNNSMDNIGIMTERGAIRNELAPKLQDLEIQTNYQETRQQLQQLQQKLRETTVGSDEYNQLSSDILNLTATMSEQQSGYDDIVRRNGNKERSSQDIQTEREALNADLNDRMERVKEYQADMEQRAKDYTISDEYKDREQGAHDHSIFSKEYMAYAMPGILGSSMNTWKAMVGTAAASYAASRAKTMLLTAAATSTGIAAIPVEAVNNVIAVGTIVGNIYSTQYQRDQEALAQTFGAHKERTKQQLESAGTSDKQIIDAVRVKSAADGEDLDNIPDEEIMDRLVSGEMKTGNKELDGIFTGNRGAIDEVYRRNMALGLSDLAQVVMTIAPVRHAFGAAAKMVTSKGVAKALSPTIKKASKGIDFITELGMKSNTTRAKVAKYVTKGVAAVGGNSMLEGVEEGDQNVFDYNFAKGKYDNASGGTLGTLFGVVEDKLELAKVLVGIDTTSELANDKQLWSDMKGGFATGMLLGAGPIVGHTINDARKDVKANNYVKGIVADNIHNKDQFFKASLYTNKAVTGNQEMVMKAFEELKKHKPDGMTDADIDEEIEHAKDIFNAAENPLNQQLAKELRISKTSEQYGKLIGLQGHLRNKIKGIDKELNTSAQQFTAAMNRHALDGSTSMLGVIQDPVRTASKSPFAAPSGMSVQGVTDMVDAFAKTAIAKRALTELIADLDSYSETNKATNLIGDAGISSKHIGTIKKSLVERLLELDEADTLAKQNELTTDQRTALDNVIETRTMRSKDAINAYKQLSILSSARNSATEDLAMLSGIKDDAFISTLPKDERAKAVTKLADYLNDINEGLKENSNQITEMRKEAEQQVEKEEAPVVANVEPATVPMSVEDVVPPKKDKEAPKPAEKPVEEVPVPKAEVTPVEKATKPVTKPTSRVEDQNDPDANFGNDDLDLTFGDEESAIKTDEDAKKLFNVPTEPPIPSTKAPTSADMSLLPNETDLDESGYDDFDEGLDEDLDQPSGEEDESFGNYQPTEDEYYDEEGVQGSVRKERVLKTPEEARAEIGIAGRLEVERGAEKEDVDAIEGMAAVVADAKLSTDFVSSTLFFQPWSTSPLKITIDGKEVTGHKSGKELSEKLKDPEFTRTAKYEFKIGTYGKVALEENKDTWHNFVVLCYIYDTEGNTYVTMFRTPETAQQFYDEYNKSTSIQALSENAKVLLFTEQQNSITKLIENRTKIIEAWFNKKDGEHIVPSSVHLSNGKFDITDKTRPISAIKNLGIPTPENCTPNHITIGFGRGIRGADGLEYTIFNPDNGSELPGFGRSGVLYIYPTTEPFRSGKPTATAIDKAKIGSVKGLSTLITKLIAYDGALTDLNGNALPKIKNAFLNMIISYGPLTVDAGVQFLTRKQVYYETNNGATWLVVGDKYYDFGNITDADFAEIDEYLANNINFRVGSEEVFTPIRTILPELVAYFDTNDELVLTPEFKITKEDLDLTYLGYLVKNNHLQSNLADNIFKDPFQYAELGDGGNSAIATTTADPKPVAPVIETETIPTKGAPEKAKNNSAFRQRKQNGGAEYTNTAQSNKPITEKELKWLRNILGIDSDKLKIVDEITGLLGYSPQVLGLMRRDSIQISTRAVRGVAYHEGYHRLSLLLMSEQEREALYAQFANDHNLPNATAGDKKALEEMMADDFANYMLNPIRRAKYLINKWFKALRHFITKTSKLSDGRVEDVYRKFATGGYKNVKENKQSVVRFNELYMDGAPFKIDGVDFKHITNASFKETIDALVAMMFDDIGFTVLGDAVALSKQTVVKFLDKENLQMLLEDGDYTGSQINALTEISDNFESVFWPRMKRSLEKFSLRVIDSEETMDQDADSATNDSDNFGVSSDLSQHTKASVEISKKANAMAEVKILIATLTEFIKDGNDDVSKINETTGFPVFVNFNMAWNKTLNGLHAESTYDGLLKKCVQLSKNDLFFSSLHEALSYHTDENIRTKILNTISSSFHNMNEINVLDVVDDNGDTIKMLELFDANILRASRIYPTLWNGQLLESDLFVRQGESFVPNKKKMTTAASLFSAVVVSLTNKKGDVNNTKTAMVGLLNFVGVSIDVATLNAYINTISDSENEYEQMLNALQAPGKGNLSSLFYWFKAMAESEDGKVYVYGSRTLDIYTFYKGIKSLKDLAVEYAKLNPNPAELTVLGADNSMLYPISQHNYLSGTIDRLNTTPEDVLALSQVTYVSGVKKGNRNVGYGSVIIEQMGRSKAPAKMKFHTMVNFKVKNSADKGRKYTGISDVEDYLMKMCYVANDHIVLPTMGDSSMYNTISGISLLHANGSVDTLTNGNLQYQFSGQAIDRMYKYLRTEYETVLNNYNNEKFLEEHPERKVANYHLGTRNGYRFRYFNRFDFVDPKSGNVVVKDFDQMLIEAERKDGTDLDRPVVKAQLEWIRKNFIDGDRTKIDRMLNDFLLNDFYKELTKAKDLGLIDYDTTAGNINTFTNKLLDQKQLAKRSTAIVRAGVNSESLAIVDLLADYFINSAVSTIEVEKVFVQDPAYYKYKLSDNKLYFADKSVDKIKRLREILSTGVVPRTDFTDGHSLANKPNFNTATLNDNVLVERQLSSIIGKAKRSYMIDLLRVMHKMSDATAQSMVDNEAHMKKYYSDVVDAATIQANRLSEGYHKVNQTDATVLISPQMYRELVERVDGWSPELEKAYNLLNDPDAKWDTNPELYAESLALTLKPLKFMYFGEHVDTELGLSVPVFDKMAMFPVHRIFSDGDMGEVLKLMEDNNIQMITFDSAVKVGMRKSTDLFNHTSRINEDGEHIQEATLNPELQNIQVYEQQFRNLRRQLITDPHHSERQMFVTQGQKQAVGNVRDDRNYTLATSKSNVTGAELKSVVKRSLDALTVKGRERIYKRFGITEDVDSDGKLLGYNLDIDLFYAELKQKAENSDMNQNVVQALTKLKDKSYVPLSSISDNNWIESALTSIFNKEIIDVNLPGGMFIQMSSVLYNKVSVGSDKGLTRQLNYINDDGSMDCVVTLNLLKHILPKGNKFTFSEAKAWLTERKVIGQDAEPIAMGYRIPAQGQSSLAALKVVDIYPEQIGDTITLPDAFTTLTGSDFD